MNPVLRTTVLVSLLLHALLYVWYARTVGSMFQPPENSTYTQEFTLAPPIELPVSTEQLNSKEPPAPRHMEDDPTKANASDGRAEKGSKTRTKRSQQSRGKTKQEAKSKQLLTSMESNTAISNKESELASEHFSKNQNMEALDDSVLGESLVESPLSVEEEERARWRNEVLKRISEQVNFAWVKPHGSSPRHTGRLKLELGADGYLKNVWVHLPSGDPNLDASILKAVKSIWRFQIPNSTLMNRYYRQLELSYQGG